MNPIVVSVVVGVLTMLGKWARGKPMDIQTVVGIVVLAVMLAGLEQVNERIAKIFGVLIIVGVLLAHSELILEKTGLGKLAK